MFFLLLTWPVQNLKTSVQVKYFYDDKMLKNTK